MTNFANPVSVTNNAQKPANIKLYFVVNAIFALLLIASGILVASDLEYYSNNVKLIVAIHGALELGYDVPGELFFWGLSLFGTLILFGSILGVRLKRSGFWLQLLGLLPIIAIGLASLADFKMLKGYTGMTGIISFYSILLISVVLLVINYRYFKKLRK